jgi:hypothetical protein
MDHKGRTVAIKAKEDIKINDYKFNPNEQLGSRGAIFDKSLLSQSAKKVS